MSCCGRKRQSLAASRSVLEQDSNSSAHEEFNDTVKSESPQTTTRFRYIGRGFLEVDGVFSRRMYRFSSGMPELLVVPEDVSVLRGYPELIELKQER
jgi:hypothetical protein